MRKKPLTILKQVFSFLKKAYFPDYHVGYFVMSVPTEAVQELIKIIRYCHMEDISGSNLMEMYLRVLQDNCKKESFISSNFFRAEEEEAFLIFERLYSELLSHEGVDIFLPSRLTDRKGTVYAKEGEVLLCTALVSYQAPIKKISSKADLHKLTRQFTSKKDKESVPVYTVKFQGSSDSETELIALELNILNT